MEAATFMESEDSLPPITLSELCNNQEAFGVFCGAYKIKLYEESSDDHRFAFVVKDLRNIEANVEINAGVSRMTTVQMDDRVIWPCVQELSEMLKPGSNDPFLISRYAQPILHAYVRFVNVKQTKSEAQFRRQIDALIELVFDFNHDGSPAYMTRVEVPALLPPLDQKARRTLAELRIRTANELNPKIDTAVLRRLTFTSDSVHLSLRIHGEVETSASVGYDLVHALADIVVQYKVANAAQVKNQVIMGMTASIYHRIRLGLGGRPVYGIGMNTEAGSTLVYVYYGHAHGPENTISIYRLKELVWLNSLKDWICFYVSLMKLKELLTDPGVLRSEDMLPSTPISEAIDDTAPMGLTPATFNSSAYTPKRDRDTDDEGPSKRQKVAGNRSSVLSPIPQRPHSVPGWLTGD